MKFDIPKDMEYWLDSVRGAKSRPAYILQILYEVKNANTKREVINGNISKTREAVTKSS